jgi:hypothetical protein
MEVRRSARTNASFGRQTFAQAETVDNRALLQGAQDLRAGLDIGRRERQGFELQKRLLEESNNAAAELEARRRDPAFDPETFSTAVDADFTDRANAITEEFRQRGFDPDLVDDFTLGYGRLRNQLTDTATTYQLQARAERAVADTSTMLDEGSRRVATSPDDYEMTAALIIDSIQLNPDLTDDQRTKLIEAVPSRLRAVGAESLVMENPDFVLGQLDPDGRWRQEREAPVTGTAASVVAATGPQGEVAQVLSGGGLSAPVVAGFLGNFEVEGGYDGAQGDGGTASGIAQWRLERRDAFRAQYGKEPHEGTMAEQAEFVLWELTTPEGRKTASISKARADEILAAQTPEEAAELIDKYYERSDGTHRDRRRKAAAKFASSADLAPGGSDVPQAGDVVAIDPGASSAEESAFSTTRDLPTEAAVPAQLHPVLRDLTGEERLRILSIADQATKKNTASQKAAMDIVIANAKAEAIENGEPAGPVPSEEEILSIYGPVAGPQVASDLRQTLTLGKSVREYAIMTPAQIAGQVERLRPQPGSPTFDTDNELFKAAQRAQAQVLEARAADPAGYVLGNFPAVQAAAERGTTPFYKEMDRALEQLGFDPAVTSPLPKAAQENVIRQWPTMAPAARRNWFQENFRTMGEDRLAAFARGAEGTDMEQELKIYAFARNNVTNPVMDEIFAGRDAIKKDPARRPSGEKVTELFRRSAFKSVLSMAPDASAALQEAAAALYVAKGGNADVLDNRIYEQALSQALGGSTPANMAKGAVKETTILPPRVSETQFEGWLEQLQPGELTRLSREGTQPLYGDLKTTVTLNDIIDDGVFVMLAPGSYGIKMASDGRFLKTATGRNFVVRLRREDIK